MLDLRFIRQNPERVRVAIAEKGIALDLDLLLEKDGAVRGQRARVQALEQARNDNAARVRVATAEERQPLIERGRAIAADLQREQEVLGALEPELQALLLRVPNLPAADAPRGATDAENVELRRVGAPPGFAFEPKDHVALLRQHGWAELERIGRVSGARSYALKDDLVLLELSLLRFTLELLRDRGFTLVSVPSFAREEAFNGTGHFPWGRDQTYALSEEALYLTGTSEVVVNALHAGELLSEEALPLRYAALSTCFRREAGSAGRDVHGLIRVHQFWKVEQYVLGPNDEAESARLHEELLRNSEDILKALELPYRVMAVCTGDMGAGKVRQHDVEAWVPSQQRYRETHSCSTLHDWQARRTQLRYRGKDGAVKLCHTLNNTGVATPRLLAPLLENHQRADGSVRVPPALRPYLGGRELLP